MGHRLLNWFAEEMGKSLYLQARNAIDHCEKNVRGHGDGNLDHQMRRGKKKTAKSQLMMVQRSIGNSTGNWSRGHPCYILAPSDHVLRT